MRTWLFVPGNDEKKLKKALHSEADVVIVDWEDAVLESEKPKAREVTKRVLGEPDFTPKPRVFLRINHPFEDFFEADIETALEFEPFGLVLPKIEAPGEVAAVAERFDGWLVPMIESAKGLVEALPIARAGGVFALLFGALDYQKDLGARYRPEAFLYAKSHLTNVSRAAEVRPPVAGVWPFLEDEAGLYEEARLERDLGFMGKTLLHPRQIPVVKRAFAPTPEEVAEARAVLDAWAEAQRAGLGVARLPDGRFIDAPVVAWAESVLEEAEG